MKKLLSSTLLFILFFTNIALAQKIDAEQNNGCNAIGIGDLKQPNKYDFYPRFTDETIPLNINTGKTVNLRMYISCYYERGYHDLPMNGILTDDKGNVITTWNSVFNYTFNTGGTFYLSYTSLCNNVPCKAGTKKIIVAPTKGIGTDYPPVKSDDYPPIKTESTFTNTLDISTGRKYYPENNINPYLVREANWQLVSGPSGSIPYPTYAWAVLGSLSADISNNSANIFKGTHWITFANSFKNTIYNMAPYVPFRFVKKFELKEGDNVYVQLKTLFDNHLAIYVDGKRLFLHHPYKNVEEIINKPTTIKDDYLDRRETFNYSYNASYVTKADGTIYLGAGPHEVVAELANASQDIGFVISGEILSAASKNNNFKSSGFTMQNPVKGSNYLFEKENIITFTDAPPYRPESKLESEKWSVRFIKDREIENGSETKLKLGTVKKIGINYLQYFYNGDVVDVNTVVAVKMPNGQITSFYNYRKFYFKTLGKYEFTTTTTNSAGVVLNYNFSIVVE